MVVLVLRLWFSLVEFLLLTFILVIIILNTVWLFLVISFVITQVHDQTGVSVLLLREEKTRVFEEQLRK